MTSAGTVLALAGLATHVPLSWLAANVRNQPNYFQASLVILASLAVTLGLLALLTRWHTDDRAFALAAAATVAWWHWSSLSSPLFVIPGPFLGVVLSGLLIAAAGMYHAHRRFRLVVVASGLTLLVVSGGLLGSRVLEQGNTVNILAAPDLQIVPGPDARKPDIVVLVLDGYARNDVLESVYGYANDELNDVFSRNSFQIAEGATTNYSVTHFSLASLLQMDYVTDPAAVVTVSDLKVLRRVLSGSNATIDALKAAGYYYVHGDTAWWGTRCSDAADICLKGAPIDTTTFELVRGTPLGAVLFANGDPGIDVSLRRFFDIENLSEATAFTERPFFAFLHLPIPHPPFYLSSTCSPGHARGLVHRTFELEDALDPAGLEIKRAAYLDQIRCANLVVERLIKGADPSTIIVVMSDHGPDSHSQLAMPPQMWTAAATKERLSILAAIRYPDSCRSAAVEPAITVNLMRSVLNCALDLELPMLPGVHFAAPTTDGVSSLLRIPDPDLLDSD